jgi:hypothetical protein
MKVPLADAAAADGGGSTKTTGTESVELAWEEARDRPVTRRSPESPRVGPPPMIRPASLLGPPALAPASELVSEGEAVLKILLRAASYSAWRCS